VKDSHSLSRPYRASRRHSSYDRFKVERSVSNKLDQPDFEQSRHFFALETSED